MTGFANKPNDIVFNNDGTKAFVARAQSNGVLSFSLSSPYSFVDITGEHSGDVIDTSNTDTYDTDPDSDTLTVTVILILQQQMKMAAAHQQVIVV